MRRLVTGRPGPTTAGALLISFLVAALPLVARADRDPGLFYGDGYAFLVDPPGGWLLDTRSGVADGFQGVFYPRGKTWANAPAVMYVHTAARENGQTLADFITDQSRGFIQKAGGHPRVEAAAALRLGSGDSASVRVFTGDRWNNRAAVGYIETQGVFVLVMLSAHRQIDFDAALPAFRDLVGSWRAVDQADVSALVGRSHHD